MGVAWRDAPQWSAVVDRAEAAAGEPLSNLLIDAPAEELGRTRSSQLSVLLASLLAWESVKDRLAPEAAGSTGHVVAFAGHSLGQITALIASGSLEFDDGIRLAVARADASQRAADANPGRMAALLGATQDQAEGACDGIDGAWVANDNAPGQIVIAGTPDGLEAASEKAKALGVKRVMALPVGGAFHTPLLQPAADDLGATLDITNFSDTTVPVVSNEDAQPYTDGSGWQQRLRTHLVRPVRWNECMATLAKLAPFWVEVGPGASLAAMAKRGQPDVSVRNVSVPADAATLSEEPS